MQTNCPTEWDVGHIAAHLSIGNMCLGQEFQSASATVQPARCVEVVEVVVEIEVVDKVLVGAMELDNGFANFLDVDVCVI